MTTMTATVARDLSIGGRRYKAAAGETVDAAPQDAGRLETFGFELVAEESSGEPTDLEDLPIGELPELAADRDLEGRSSMTKAELVSALESPTSQEA